MIMASRVLVLSRKPLAERPLHTWLEELVSGVVLVTTPDALASTDPGVPEHFLAFRTSVSYRSWQTERIAAEAASEFGVDLIASSSEDDVLRAARLRRRLGLPGQSEESAVAYRDKLTMKQTLQLAGIRVPAMTPLVRPSDLLDFADKFGLPVVVKPARGMGSAGVRFLTGPGDVTRFLESGAMPAAPRGTERWMAEEFIDGPLFHVDGVTVDGTVLHCWPARYSSGNAQAAQASSILSSILLAPEDPFTSVLQGFAARVHAALPAPPFPTSFHLEAWIGADGTPILCEVACRTGGGPVAATYQNAFGVHLSKENLRGQCGLDIALRTQPAAPDRARGWVILPPGHGRFSPPRGPCPVADTEIQLKMRPGALGDGVHHAGDSAAHALVSASDPATLADRVEEVSHWWARECTWT